jgi:3-oxoacyl-[acyl-carrier protein] reductase
MLTLNGRSALITGGTRNIGLEIAKTFASNGMNVAIIGKNAENLKAALDELSVFKVKTFGALCDLNEITSIPEILKQINQEFNGIDVVVNSAGLLDMSKIETITETEWDTVLDVNLKGSFFVVKYCLEYLKNSKFARVINISSNSGRMGGFENGMAYSASKGGLISLTYGLARQLAPFGITVNCIAPGTIESEMSRARDAETIKRLLGRFPIGRFGRVDEVASAACYFASEEASFTTGAVLDVNGGLFMG